MFSAWSSSATPTPYWTQPPKSHRDVVARYNAEYNTGVADGTILPFVYPIVSLAGGLALAFFLFVPPRSVLHNVYTRYAVFLFIVWWHSIYISKSKGLNNSTSFGIGIVLSFSALWAAVLLIFDDKKLSAKRVDRLDVSSGTSGNASMPSTAEESRSKLVARRRRNPSTAPSDEELDRLFPLRRPVTYYWQHYPMEPFSSRVDWVLDLWTNFRGVGFDFKPTGLPSYPLDVQQQLVPDKQPKDTPVSRTGLERRDSYWPLLRRHVWILVKGYLVCDLLIVLVHHDAYFWGVLDSKPPDFLPAWAKDSRFPWIRAYRISVGMSIIWTGLRTVYSMAPVFFVGLLGPDWLGVRGEPWLYPDHYGRFSNIFERGLAGWWGGWWHQIFRCAFQAAGSWITRNLGVDDKSLAGKSVHVWTAFILSGVLHASGSATQMGPTNPMAPLVFFCLQPLGIMAEVAWHGVLERKGLANRFPKWLVYASNFIWVCAWFLLTAPLLIDDMAKGGLWIIEPVTFSPLRAMGFGVEGDGFYCWEGSLFTWHRGESWLTSGIAL